MEEAKKKLVLELWRLRCLRSSRVFYLASERAATRETKLTLANLASSILVLFFSLGHSLVGMQGSSVDFAIALASSAVVITSASQYFLGYGKISREFGEAGARYAAMNRKIEFLTADSPTEQDINGVKDMLDELGKTTPVLPKAIWNLAATLNQEIAKLEDTLFARVHPEQSSQPQVKL